MAVTFACSGQEKVKQSQETEKKQQDIKNEVQFKVLDPYTYLLMHYDNSGDYDARMRSVYGFKAAYRQTETDGNTELYLRNCSYDSAGDNIINWNEKSSAIGFYRNGTRVIFQMFVDDREEIIQELKRYGFECDNYGDAGFFVDNGFVGLESYLENSIWHFVIKINAEEDYPFYSSLNFSQVEQLLKNELKIEEDYRSERFRMSGEVSEIEERGLIIKEVLYRFKKNNDLFSPTIRIYVPKDESSYYLDLPANVVISGFVTNVEGNSIYLKKVRIFDKDKKSYVGPNIPNYDFSPSSIQSADPESGEEFILNGCLSDGKKEYGIEMFLHIEDNEAEGYYRYLSKPDNAVIGLEGTVELEPTGGSGVYAYSRHVRLKSEDKKEVFTFEIHPAYQEVEGEWYLYYSPADASSGKTAKKLAVHLTWE